MTAWVKCSHQNLPAESPSVLSSVIILLFFIPFVWLCSDLCSCFFPLFVNLLRMNWDENSMTSPSKVLIHSEHSVTEEVWDGILGC